MELKDKIIFGIAIGLIVVLTTVISIMGLFSIGIFFIMLFFIMLFFSIYFYLKFGFDENLKYAESLIGRKKKFDYCWERVNELLRGRENGQGLRWNSGDEVSSKVRTFTNGVSSKTCRAFLGYLEKSNIRVIVIYDMDENDIADLNLSPTAEHILDMFYQFKPYEGGGQGRYDGDFGDDSYGSYNRRNNSGINLNFGNRNDDFNDLEPTQENAENAASKLD